MIGVTRRALLLSATLSAAATGIGTAAAGAAEMTTAVLAAVFAGPVQPARAQSTDMIDQPLRDLHAALEATMRAGRATPFRQRFDALAPVVDRVFDLETVLKVSVGLRWDSMDPDTRTRLLHAYRRFTVATYVANFDKFDGERFQILPGARNSGTDRIVPTEILTSGDPMRLDYVMRDGNGAWRVVDVLFEGSISRVAVQRSDFRKILASGDADALITSLRRKIADLSDGALNS